MDSESVNSSSSPAIEVPDAQNVSVSGQEKSTHGAPSLLSPSGISSWTRSFRTPPSVIVAQEESETGNDGNSDSAQASNGNDVQTSTVYGQDKSATDTPSLLSPSGISAWARNLGIPTPSAVAQENSQNGHDGRTNFARFTNRLALTLSKVSTPDENSTASDSGVLESFKKGLVDSSRNAVKAVQVKARHIVSQNKRRYQEGGFDLDMSYITENIIAMGFPAGDMSSGIFGYLEGFYRNHMEEVIEFLETNHKGKYKVYNLCSERLYDASLFEGKVASFPFDDHNCPPMELILPFCQSAYSWLKGDIENVVVVHCKAGMARTGLMISSLLVFMKFFPTAEESIDYFNQKRCLDGKGLVLPSQIRYVKYFECILTQFDGECPPARRCMLRGFRLHKCPFWIRPSITISNHKGILFSTKKHPKTKNLMPEDFWISAPKKGILVFALPREPGVAELTGDFKIHFHDRQGDFYCWLNTSMMENRITLNTCDLDGFEKRNVPCPGFQIDVVMIDYKGDVATISQTETNSNESGGNSSASKDGAEPTSNQNKSSGDDDDVFSDNESEGSGSSRRRRQSQAPQSAGPATSNNIDPQTGVTEKETAEQISLTSSGRAEVPKGEAKNDGISAPVSNLQVPKLETMGANEIKAIAADASVFSFGDEDEESD